MRTVRGMQAIATGARGTRRRGEGAGFRPLLVALLSALFVVA